MVTTRSKRSLTTAIDHDIGLAEQASRRHVQNDKMAVPDGQEETIAAYASPRGASHELRENTQAYELSSPLYTLPKELRLYIWEYLVEDQHINLSATIYSRPAYTYSQEPAITKTCHAVRDEILPIYYARTEFTFVICRPEGYERLKRAINHRMRKLTILGYAHNGLVQLTFDLPRSRIVDSRWRMYQNLGRPPRAEHWHFAHELRPIMHKLDELTQKSGELRGEAAIKMLLKETSKFFWIYRGNRTLSLAGGPSSLSAESVGPCECMLPVAPESET